MKKNQLLKNVMVLFISMNMLLPKLIAQQFNGLINSHLAKEQEKNKWAKRDIASWLMSDLVTDKATGLVHAYVQQTFNNIPVYNAISVFAIKNEKVVYFKAGLIPKIGGKVKAKAPSVTAEAAIAFALQHLKKESSEVTLIESNKELNRYVFNAPAISNKPVRVQLVYRQTEKGVFLCWDVSIDFKKESHWWNVRVDALTGEYVDKNDYFTSCAFEKPAGNVSPYSNVEVPEEAAAFMPMPTATSSYNVFPLPVEAPSFGSRAVLNDPASVSASPFGWNDTDGAAGAEYTITRGNNTYTYEDQDNDDLPGYSPDGGVNLNFDFLYNPSSPPAANMDAALTNLFYMNNAIHDYLYPLGFDGASGNFQENTYGNGGSGADAVQAEGFDGSGDNNANFGTPPDGFAPRMQMYLWTGDASSCSSLNVTSTGFTGTMGVAVGAFSSIGTATADLILADDGIAPASDACEPLVNNIAGKVVLIDRGTCTFVSKAMAAEAAGAAGVIIANNNSTPPFAMSGSPTVSIPCIMISQVDGNTLKAALLGGTTTVTITTCLANELDGSVDNGIIAHEYGHGVSNRLTGGPSNTSCLYNAEQGGEGWSDWLALMATIEPGDQGTNARNIGTYVRTGGIRTQPYSTDMSINTHTYSDIAANPEVHYIGEIWCSAIWDMSWLIIDQEGFNADPTVATAGNNIAMKLVLEGMKLQPCGPGFLDARNAILSADTLLYGASHSCLIWEAFARRGMGVNADQGSANIVGDEMEDFHSSQLCVPPTVLPVAAFTSDINTITCGQSVQFTDNSTDAFSWLWNFGDGNTSTLRNPLHIYNSSGSFNVSLTATNILGSNVATQNAYIVSTSNFTVTATATPSAVCNSGNSVLTALATAPATPSYCEPASICAFDDYISQVTFAGINRSSACDNSAAYSLINTPNPTVTATTNYSLSVGTSALYEEGVAVWIDYDHSGTFEASELVLNGFTGSVGANYSGTVNIPATAINGATIMRVKCFYFDDPSLYDPCDPYYGETEDYKITISGGSSYYSYSWSPITFLGSPTGPSVTATALNATTSYTAMATAPNGCSATASATVTLNTSVPATPGTISGPAVVCQVTSTTYSIAPVTDATSYVWTVPSGVTITSGQGTIAINVNIAAGTIGTIISVKASNPCGLSPAKTLLITKKPGVPGTITGTSLCGNTTATYSIAPVFGATTYIWNVPTGLTITSAPTVVIVNGSPQNHYGTSITVSKASSFISGQIKVSAFNACGNIQGPVKTVYGKAPATPAPVTGLTSVCAPSTGTYTTTGSAGATSYTWTITGNATVSGSGASATVNFGAGFITGTLSVTATNPCGTSYAKTLAIKKIACSALLSPIAIDNADETNAALFNLYPNPTSGAFTLTMNGEQEIVNNEGLKIEIYDVLGNKVVQSELRNSTSEINLESFRNGMYLLRVIDVNGNTYYSQRVIKE